MVNRPARGLAGATRKIAPEMSFDRHASTRSARECNVARLSLQYPVQRSTARPRMSPRWLPRGELTNSKTPLVVAGRFGTDLALSLA